MPLTSNDELFLKSVSELPEAEVFLKSELPEQSYGEEFRFSKLAKYELYRRSDAKRDAREEAMLSITRKALSNSNRANIIAIIATIIAAIAIILGKS